MSQKRIITYGFVYFYCCIQEKGSMLSSFLCILVRLVIQYEHMKMKTSSGFPKGFFPIGDETMGVASNFHDCYFFFSERIKDDQAKGLR